MEKHETKIERIIRENTPDFVVGTSHLIDQFHSYNFYCQVFFRNGKIVQKKDNFGILKKYKVANPDFVLQNKKQMNDLNEVISSASK